MFRSASALFLFLSFTPFPAQATVQVQKYLMTKPKPSSDCSSALANTPQAYSSFAVTDPAAYLWFYVTGANAGDVFATAYYAPSGQFYGDPSGSWDPLDEPGNWCFLDTPFYIAGHRPASEPGTWRVVVSYNATQLFSLSFTVGSSTGPTPTTLYYRFEDGTANAAASGAGSIADNLGSGQNGTPSGTVTWRADVPAATVKATGAANALSLEFGNNGSVRFTGAFPLNTLTDATLELWIKPAASSSEMDFLWTRTDAADANRFNMGVLSGSGGRTVFLDYREPNGTLHTLAPGIPISSSGWTHVAVVKRGNTWTGYSNGVQQGQPVVDANPNLPNNTGWTLAGRGYPSYTGLLDELRISNSALAPSQFLNGGASGGTTDLTGNLIVNGDAEAGPDSPSFNGLPSIPGWQTDGNVTVYRYDRGDELLTTSPGPPARGNNFFAGGYSAVARMSQSVNVAGSAALIDAGGQAFTLSGWIGGWDGQDDNTVVKATFQGASGAALGTASIGPVMASDRKDVSGLLERTATGKLPGGTRSVLVSVEFTRTSGSANDGNADNLYFGLGGGGSITCTYSLSAPTQSVSAAASTATVNVSAPAGCSWTAASNAAWITVTSAAGGSGNGTVSYRIDANGGSARSGTLTIAGITFTVSQAAAATCTYAVDPTQVEAPAAGMTGTVRVTAAGGCAWAATSNSGWITINSGASGSGGGSVSYTVAANPAAASRGGSLRIAGSTVSVNQAGAPAANPPVITLVSNAASMLPAATPAGGIAQGALFSLTGSNLGPGNKADPTTGVSAGAPPLAATLGDVSVRVTAGDFSAAAYPVFAWAGRVDAIMPSNTPLGKVSIVVTYNGQASRTASATVVTSNFGAFTTTLAGSGRAMLMLQSSETDPGVQNTNSRTAMPNQIVSLIGTGLGAVGQPDYLPPPAGDLPAPVQVLVGGATVAPMHAARLPGQPGKDYIQFRIPAEAPGGCNVPVQVLTGGTTYSNTVTISIDAAGQPCSSINPWVSQAESGGKTANILLIRLQASLALSSGRPPSDLTIDLGVGIFNQIPPGGGAVISMLAAIPSLGTCGSIGGSIDLTGILNAGTSAGNNLQTLPALDAGDTITITGPSGSRPLPAAADDDGKRLNNGMYLGLLGAGGMPLLGEDTPGPFLEPGAYTLSAPGGKDIGAFQAKLSIPPPVKWTNKDAITTIDRAAPLPITWTGGSDAQVVLIFGGGTDSESSASGGFVCFVPSTPGGFNVPASALANLPASGTGSAGDLSAGLLIGTVPAGGLEKFTAAGLDSGYLFYGMFEAKTLALK